MSSSRCQLVCMLVLVHSVRTSASPSERDGSDAQAPAPKRDRRIGGALIVRVIRQVVAISRLWLSGLRDRKCCRW